MAAKKEVIQKPRLKDVQQLSFGMKKYELDHIDMRNADSGVRVHLTSNSNSNNNLKIERDYEKVSGTPKFSNNVHSHEELVSSGREVVNTNFSPTS